MLKFYPSRHHLGLYVKKNKMLSRLLSGPIRHKIFKISLQLSINYFLNIGHCYICLSLKNVVLQGVHKYLLLTEVEVRTVSYGSSFFPVDLWSKRERTAFDFSGPFSETRPAKLTNHNARTNRDIIKLFNEQRPIGSSREFDSHFCDGWCLLGCHGYLHCGLPFCTFIGLSFLIITSSQAHQLSTSPDLKKFM